MFGRNPDLPSVLVDRPPAFEGRTISTMFGKHLNALHASRQAFIKAETSERIGRALRHLVRPSANFRVGDLVYYKGDNQKKWKGPGKVLGQDGKVILVCHGSTYIRVHPCRPSKMEQSTEHCKQSIPNDKCDGERHIIQKDKDQVTSSNINKDNDDDSKIQSDSNEIKGQINDSNPLPNDSRQISDPYPMQENLEDGQHGILRTGNSPDDNASDQASTRISKMPKVGTKVRYLPSDDTLWKEAEILSRAGKATGKNKNWLNIKDKDEEAKSIDWIQCVDDWQAIEEFSNTNDLPEEDEVYITMSRHSEQEVREAKQKE